MEKKKWSKYKKAYNPKWEMKPEFQDWVRKGDSEYHINCMYCNKNIRAHCHDLKKHANTSLHQRNAISFSNIKTNYDESTISHIQDDSQTQESSKLQEAFTEDIQYVFEEPDLKTPPITILTPEQPSQSKRMCSTAKRKAQVVSNVPVEIETVEYTTTEVNELESLKRQRLQAQIQNEELTSYKLKLEVLKLERELGLAKSNYTRSLN